MKQRSGFVSNSSTSSFIVDATSANEAKERLAECIAKFLDEKATHERHLQIAREFIDRECKAESLEFAKIDDSLSFRDRCELLWTDYPENTIQKEDEGKVVMVDHERNSVISEYAEIDTWIQDEERIHEILKESGFERR